MGDAAEPVPDPEDAASAVLTRDLLERARRGDEEAERRLFATHRQWLLAHAARHRLFRHVRRTVTADDLVQETLTRFLSRSYHDGFEDQGRGSLRRFLGRILDRVIHDQLRRLGTQKRGGNTRTASLDQERGEGEAAAGLGEAVPAGDPTPTSRTREQEFRVICRQTLTPEEWEVFRRIKLEGRTSREVGEILGRDPATVRGILAGARRKLVVRLREAWDGRSEG